MPTSCPMCSQALEKLVQEIRKVAAKDPLVSRVASQPPPVINSMQ